MPHIRARIGSALSALLSKLMRLLKRDNQSNMTITRCKGSAAAPKNSAETASSAQRQQHLYNRAGAGLRGPCAALGSLVGSAARLPFLPGLAAGLAALRASAGFSGHSTCSDKLSGAEALHLGGGSSHKAARSMSKAVSLDVP